METLSSPEIGKSPSQIERKQWYFLNDLPLAIKEKLIDYKNIPKFIRQDLKETGFTAFGYHIGSVPAETGKDYLLVPSDDKGYGYGVFFNPERVALRFAGGKRYQRKPEILPIFVVPIDEQTHFKYSPKGDLVGSTNGRAVLLHSLNSEQLTISLATEKLNLPEMELENLLRAYQRNVTHFQICWSKKYSLVPLAIDEARAIRNQDLTIDEALEYIGAK